jgi:hypothetical protein
VTFAHWQGNSTNWFEAEILPNPNERNELASNSHFGKRRFSTMTSIMRRFLPKNLEDAVAFIVSTMSRTLINLCLMFPTT